MFNIFTKLYNLFNEGINKIIIKGININKDDDEYITDNEEDTLNINDKSVRDDKSDKGDNDDKSDKGDRDYKGDNDDKDYKGDKDDGGDKGDKGDKDDGGDRDYKGDEGDKGDNEYEFMIDSLELILLKVIKL